MHIWISKKAGFPRVSNAASGGMGQGTQREEVRFGAQRVSGCWPRGEVEVLLQVIS